MDDKPNVSLFICLLGFYALDGQLLIFALWFVCRAVDGRWTSWTEWTQCNVTCGGGRQQRTRHCEAPQYGGQRCRGFPKQTRQCNSKHCPGELSLALCNDN